MWPMDAFFPSEPAVTQVLGWKPSPPPYTAGGRHPDGIIPVLGAALFQDCGTLLETLPRHIRVRGARGEVH